MSTSKHTILPFEGELFSMMHHDEDGLAKVFNLLCCYDLQHGDGHGRACERVKRTCRGIVLVICGNRFHLVTFGVGKSVAMVGVNVRFQVSGLVEIDGVDFNVVFAQEVVFVV